MFVGQYLWSRNKLIIVQDSPISRRNHEKRDSPNQAYDMIHHPWVYYFFFDRWQYGSYIMNHFMALVRGDNFLGKKIEAIEWYWTGDEERKETQQ